MLMPPAAGFCYIIQAQCSLSVWPKWHALHVKTTCTFAAFIFEDILCRWGAIAEIVTDNSTIYVTALNLLINCYGIHHICISSYNSCANGIIKHQHHMIQESIIKACEGNISKWPTITPHAFWVDHTMTHKSTSHTPFYMAHSVEPVLPLNITLATFLVPDITTSLPTSDLLTICMCQLQKHETDLATIHDNILHSHFNSVQQFVWAFKKSIKDYNFKPGMLVLIYYSSIESDLGHKSKPFYIGPMIVICHTPNGSYCLAKLDSAISKLHFAAFHLIPYHACLHSSIPITHIIKHKDLMRIHLNEDQDDPAAQPGDREEEPHI